MKIQYVLMMCGLLGLASCVDDESTYATNPISEIIIEEGSVKERYDINKNEVLSIKPQCRQTNKKKALSYTWEIDQKVYSQEEVFVYTGDRLGSYDCRLIVENEDGKAFFPFKLNVNSPYEEGITVLSCDPQGKSMLSFMLKQLDGNVEEHFEDGDCFAVNNPDMHFASNASDMMQCGGNLIISCKGGETDGSSSAVYYLNEKTFVVQNYIDASEYPDFKPIKLAIPNVNSSGISYPILCENGSVYELSITESVIIPSIKMKFKYAPTCTVRTANGGGKYSLLFWDEINGGLCQIMNGYGPYYCSKDYLVSIDKLDENNNYFKDRQFVGMFMPRVPQGFVNTETPDIWVIVKPETGPMHYKVQLNSGFWVYDENTGKNSLVDNGGYKICAFATPKFHAQSPHVASRLYYTLFFGEGNNVYAWNYTTSQRLDQAKVYCSPGTEQAVVTSMELSEDQQELFVAFYEPAEEGLNGHVWVYDTQEGRLLRKYDNVCYRPVKIMYKKK